MLEQGFLVEEDSGIRLVDCVAQLNAENTGVLNVVDSFGGEMALLQKAYAEMNTIACEVALIWDS